MQHAYRIHPQPPQAGVHRPRDSTIDIGHLLCRQPYLGGNDRGGPATLQRDAQDLLGLAIAIAGGNGEEVHPQIQGAMDCSHRFRLGGGPPHLADAPTAEPHP
jgi:hypothetical protein